MALAVALFNITETTAKKSKKSKKSSDIPSLHDSTFWPAPSEAKELPVETPEKKEKRPPRGMLKTRLSLNIQSRKID
jgi:hypothetical protein